MNASLGVKNDQHEEADDNSTDESDEETPFRTVVQEIEKSHILLLTPI